MLNLTWQRFQQLARDQFYDAILNMIAFSRSSTKIVDGHVAQNEVCAE